MVKNKAPTQRQLRMNELIRHVLAGIFNNNELHDPRLENIFFSVSEVRVSPDFSNADIYISALGMDITADHLLILNGASGLFRKHLSAELQTRKTPKLHFVADDIYHNAQHIDALLNLPHVRQDIKGK